MVQLARETDILPPAVIMQARRLSKLPRCCLSTLEIPILMQTGK